MASTFGLELSPKSFYESEFLNETEADLLFTQLNSLNEWGKHAYNNSNLNRETMVFASDEIVDNPERFRIPAIWGTDVKVVKFPEFMVKLIAKMESKYEMKSFNIALGNRYLKANDKIGQHSDNEEFGNTQSIASISLGIPRSFNFKSKDITRPENVTLFLNHGSLLFMGENCQENYTHGMKTDAVSEHATFKKTRINVTFRVWNY